MAVQAVQPVNKHFTVCFEGIPAAGKTTIVGLISEIARGVLDKDKYIIAVNGGVDKGAFNDEKFLEEKPKIESRQGKGFLEKIYGPGKEEYYHDATHIGYMLNDAERGVNERFPVDAAAPKMLVNFVERTSGSAAAMFIPAAHYNLRESTAVGRMKEDADFDAVRPVQYDLINRYTAEVKRMHAQGCSMSLVYVRCEPDVAHDKMVKRGRKFEATGLTKDYMRRLHQIHERFFSLEIIDDKVVPSDYVYLGLDQFRIVDTTSLYDPTGDFAAAMEKVARDMFSKLGL